MLTSGILPCFSDPKLWPLFSIRPGFRESTPPARPRSTSQAGAAQHGLYGIMENQMETNIMGII